MKYFRPKYVTTCIQFLAPHVTPKNFTIQPGNCDKAELSYVLQSFVLSNRYSKDKNSLCWSMIIFKDPNFSSVSKKKKKADPGQLKAKEEKRS